MLIDQNQIEKYIPQRPPFVMLDSLLSANENGFESTFTILPAHIMLFNGVLSEGALVENIAQTCAAGFGYLNSLKGEAAGQLGFIGSVSKLVVHGEAHENDALETSIKCLSTFESIHLVEGSVSANGKLLLVCQMKIVLA